MGPTKRHRCQAYAVDRYSPGSGQANYLEPLEISEKYTTIYPLYLTFWGLKEHYSSNQC
jgi:hypothetical protein